MAIHNKVTRKHALGVFLFIVTSGLAAGQEKDSVRGAPVNGQPKKWYSHPLVSSRPETGLLLGMGFFYTIRQTDSATRISFLTGSLSASLKGYYSLNAGIRHFAAAERWLMEGDIAHANFPTRFYGIGNAIDPDTYDLYYSKTFKINLLIYREIRRHLFLSAGYRYGCACNVRSDENGILDRLRPEGYRGHHVSAPQVALLYDSRDNPLAATRGWYFKWGSSVAVTQFGSSYRFSVQTLDVRTYIKIPRHRQEDVLALQATGMSTHGDVPFTELALMGGPVVMRGYYSGQYRDYHFMAIQAEYRYHVNNWFGVAGFAGAGSVMPGLFAIRGKIKPNYGCGVRLALPASNRLSLRIDYGWGINTGSLTIGLMEAF